MLAPAIAMTGIVVAAALLVLAAPPSSAAQTKEDRAPRTSIPFERPVFPMQPLDAHGPYLILSAGAFENHGRDMRNDVGATAGRAVRSVAGWRLGRIAAEATFVHADLGAAGTNDRVQVNDLCLGVRATPIRAVGGRVEAMLLASASPYATARRERDWYRGWSATTGAGVRVSLESRAFIDVDASWRFARFTQAEHTERGETKRTKFARPRNADAFVVLVGGGLQF